MGEKQRNTRSIDVTNDLRVSYVNHLRWLVSIAPICVTTAQQMETANVLEGTKWKKISCEIVGDVMNGRQRSNKKKKTII